MTLSGTYKTQHGDLTITQHGVNITATYQDDGVCIGSLIENKIEGIWKNKKDQGVFEWTFDDNGSFTGKYKSGIEDGAMRGKWDGKPLSSESVINLESKPDSDNESENVSELEIYIRYSDGDEEVGNFSINIESELKMPKEISYESLTNLISYSGLYEDENFLNAVKHEVSTFSLSMSDCPQIFVTKINTIDLKPLYENRFNSEENEEIVAALLNVNSDEVSDLIRDYFSETAYSVENLF